MPLKYGAEDPNRRLTILGQFVYYHGSPQGTLSQGVPTVTTLPTPVRVDDDILRKYDALIEVLRKNESRDPAANRFPWQCEVAVRQLAEFATLKQKQINASGANRRMVIRLRTDSLPLRIYGGDVGQQLKSFVASSGELRILITELDYDTASVDRFVGLNNVSVRQETLPGDTVKNHFFLVDEQAYRFEAVHGRFSGCEFRSNDDFHPVVPARICFNDREGSAVLSGLFDELWQNAVDVKPQRAGDADREPQSAKSADRATTAS